MKPSNIAPEDALRSQEMWFSCAAQYGHAGLGQHLAQAVREAREQGQCPRYYAPSVPEDDPYGYPINVRHQSLIFQYTPVRFSPSWKSFLSMDLFDREVSKRLKAGDTFVGFVGQALHSFRRARSLGYRRLELEVANSHVANVEQTYAKARLQYGFEAGWLNKAQIEKTLKEYALADRLIANSDYTRDSLIANGVSPEKIGQRTLNVQPRFQCPHSRPDDGVFRIVYTGSLTITKGIPLLLEAFSRLDSRKGNLQLTLVGGWATRAMKNYLGPIIAQDSRISIAPGDPFPHLQRANLYVHPTYNDGFGYAPAEALACGTPVLVTEDTGMKELIRPGINGRIFPTGDLESLIEHLEFLRESPLPCRVAPISEAIMSQKTMVESGAMGK